MVEVKEENFTISSWFYNFVPPFSSIVVVWIVEDVIKYKQISLLKYMSNQLNFLSLTIALRSP